MSGFNKNMPLIGAGAVRRTAISAGALLALVAVVLSGSGYNPSAAQEVPGGLEPAPAPGGLAPGFQDPPNNEAPTEEPLELEVPGNEVADTAPDPSDQPANGGYGGYGLINGEHYPSDKLIIVYDGPIGPLGVVNEESTATTETLLHEIEVREAIAFAVSEDIAELDGGFDITNLEVFGGVPELNTIFVRADGEFDPLEVSFALNDLENVEFAHPDYYVKVAQGTTTTQGDCFGRRLPTRTSAGLTDLCRGTNSNWVGQRQLSNGSTVPDQGRADWYIDNINLDDALEFVASNQGDNPDPLVAVIDTGFIEGHPDLAGRWLRPNRKGWRFWEKEPIDTTDDDPNPFVSGPSHGSQVTSILAGKQGNQYGAYGVYQGGAETILPLRGLGSLASVIEAVRLAEAHDADIINGSFVVELGPPATGQNWCDVLAPATHGTITAEALRRQIAAFDGLFVAAAGNRYLDIGGTQRHAPSIYRQVVPTSGNGAGTGNCGRTLNNLIVVGATEIDEGTQEVALWRDEGLSAGDEGSGSSYSGRYVDIAAPGEDVFVSNGDERYPSYFFVDSNSLRRTGNVLSGTSLAAPQVAGTAALMLQVNPDLEPWQMSRILRHTGWHEPALDGFISGGKTLDANAAVRCAQRLNGFEGTAFVTFLRSLCEVPELEFFSTSQSGDEDRAWVEFRVNSRNGVTLSRDVSLTLLWGGTADVDYDYQFALERMDEASGNWIREDNPWRPTFPKDSSSARYRFLILEDSTANEGDETVVLTLLASTNNVDVYRRGGRNIFTYTIVDDDAASSTNLEFGFFSTEGSHPEAGSSVYFWVDAMNGVVPARDITLKLERSGDATAGRDYVNGWWYTPSGTSNERYQHWNNNPQSFTFPANNHWVTFRLEIVDDNTREADEDLILTLSSDDPNVSFTNRVFTHTIRNDD